MWFNGICGKTTSSDKLVCSCKIKIEIDNDKNGSFIKSATGFQIVNGGQTTATLYRTKKQDNADFTNVVVPAKITLVKKEYLDEVVPTNLRVCQFSKY